MQNPGQALRPRRKLRMFRRLSMPVRSTSSALAAAQALHQQYGIRFSHIGVTIMIGRADTQYEVTSLHDIDTINAFVISNHLPTSRFWSFDRDTPNGTGGSNSNGNGAPILA